MTESLPYTAIIFRCPKVMSQELSFGQEVVTSLCQYTSR